jgi:hypothetical protein
MHLVQIQPSVFVAFVDQIFNIRSIELVAFSQARDSVECLADGSPIFCLRARLSLSSQNCFNLGFDGQAFFAGLRRQFVGNVHGYLHCFIFITKPVPENAARGYAAPLPIGLSVRGLPSQRFACTA